MDLSGLSTIKKAIVAFVTTLITALGVSAEAASVDLKAGLISGVTALISGVLVYATKNAQAGLDAAEDAVNRV